MTDGRILGKSLELNSKAEEIMAAQRREIRRLTELLDDALAGDSAPFVQDADHKSGHGLESDHGHYRQGDGTVPAFEHDHESGPGRYAPREGLHVVWLSRGEAEAFTRRTPYTITVTAGVLPHTAFTSARAFRRWMGEGYRFVIDGRGIGYRGQCVTGRVVRADA